MNALFDAVQSQASTSQTSQTSNAGGQTDFASALSAVISQASNGKAPAELQNAFDQLMGSATGGAAGVTLTQLLTGFQQQLGYGMSAGSSATGNWLNAKA